MKNKKWKNINLLLIIFILFSLIKNNLCKRCDNYGGNFYINDHTGPFTNTGLSCGKSNPKEQEDCTKYGTDSGMYCCWVAKDENDNHGKCYLVSEKKIERSGIDGCAQFSDSYWSCGNFGRNLKIDKIIFGIFSCIFLLM